MVQQHVSESRQVGLELSFIHIDKFVIPLVNDNSVRSSGLDNMMTLDVHDRQYVTDKL